MKRFKRTKLTATAMALAALVMAGSASAQVALETLYHFTGGADGNGPSAGLTLGQDGNLFGVTFTGGDTNLNNGFGDGTVFRITPAGQFTRLVAFAGTNGRYPWAEVISGVDGALYGTTFEYGIGGTVYRATTNGTLTTLAWLNETNGASAAAPLVLGADGWLYGEGQGGGGVPTTIFRVGTNGGLSVLFQFGDPSTNEWWLNGWDAIGGLTFGSDGCLYGSTAFGGSHTNALYASGMGTLFKITTNGTWTQLAAFAGTNGAFPHAQLTLGSDGSFYGTTAEGGITNSSFPKGMGTVFRLQPDSTLETLVQFQFAAGANPQGRLLEGPDGAFYGTTGAGGSTASGTGAGDGTIFKITTNGVLTTLHLFNEADGSNPRGGLVRGADGSFYGTTGSGGTFHSGTVFKLPMVPVISQAPVATVCLSDDSVVFTASAGGSPAPTFTWCKDGVPIVDSEHCYAISIGTNTAFYINNADWRDAGNYSVMASNVFGATTSSNALLTVLEIAPAITAQPVNRTNELTGNAIFTVAASGHPTPAYQWLKDGAPLANDARIAGATSNQLIIANLSSADAGNYSVQVTNHAGAITSLAASLTVLPTVWQIPAALDATNYIWLTGGDADWVPDSNLDGAYPGTIGDSQESWLETSITGPAVLSFWWWVDSERNHDYLAFYLDGARWARISGVVDRQETFTIAPGTHTVRWSYYKDASGAAGGDSGGLYSLSIIPYEPRIKVPPQSHTNFVGTAAQFTVTATGVPDPAYQWRKDGADLPGETAAALVLPSVTLTDAGGYSVVVTNTSGSITSAVATLTVLPAITLAEALNATNLVWSVSGDAHWQPTAEFNHDSFAGGQSGVITDSQASRLQTSVTGPGTLGFWWKVSSEAGCDYLTLYTNGVMVDAISGEVNWAWRTVELGPGTHSLRWEYAKDSSYANGLDAAWLDQVSFLSSTPVAIPLAARLADGKLILSWEDAAFNLQSATNLPGPFVTIPGATSPFTNNPAAAQQFFRLQTP